MRKMLSRAAGVLLACAMAVGALALAPAPALAAPAEDGYTYTVRIHAGEGTIGGAAFKEEPGLEAGETVPFKVKEVTPPAGYYVRGIRVSGEDTILSSTDYDIPVTCDAEYVIAYGVPSSQVEYTVNFVDANGAPLIAPATYTGNEGDAPVVAATYIAGYEPRQTTLTDTLSSDGTNAFTFVYDAIPENVVTTTVTNTETTTTAAAAAAPAAAAAAPAAAAAAPAAAAAAPAAAAPAAGEAAAATPGAAAGGETIGGNATPTAGPNATTGNGTGNGTTGNGTQSIPNEPGPTSGPQTTTTAAQGVPMPMLVIGALAVIGAIAAIATRLTNKDGE